MDLNVQVVGIDYQRDFIESNGALSVPGAKADAGRFAAVIKKHNKVISDINLTMDSHHWVHIAHPVYWINSNGQHPAPFTVISEDDVNKGKYRTTNPADMPSAVAYVASLAASGRFALCIWPPHCLIGSKGWLLDEDVYNAAHEWQESKPYAFINVMTKGSNLHTEHYSAVKAEVSNNDPTTHLNMDFIDMLQKADLVIAGGEALSHCFRYTLEDIVANFGADNVKKIVLLEDCCSVIPGFEAPTHDFINDMRSKGMQIMLSTDLDKLI